MISQIHLILILEILQGWGQKVEVTQSDRLLIVRAGQPVNISCHQTSKDHYVAVWYQQVPSGALQTMVYSPDPGITDMEAGYQSWKLQRPSNLQSWLSKAGAEAQDSAVYYCASSSHSGKRQRNGLHKTCTCTRDLQGALPLSAQQALYLQMSRYHGHNGPVHLNSSCGILSAVSEPILSFPICGSGVSKHRMCDTVSDSLCYS
ncbi:unnamed protein product [Ranitomeya imitator]|uniref:Immunoglobulin domain-containing protein n=1 Tax=Ranitomeya imitator TaxID=111125 RepID=A0ABN9LGN2_9NEOB|nr:unnamed protein product [Ranitomeya imitator]